MAPLALLFAWVTLQTPAQEPQSLTVFAAVSLKESFTTMARSFERAHPGAHVELQFAGSQQLAAQITNGAPCDVFASADERNLDKVAFDPQSRRVFAKNLLVVVTPAKDAPLRDLKELANKYTMVLPSAAVPAGEYGRQALVAASKTYGREWLSRIESHVVSLEQDVRASLAKVVLGEADASIVYATDAASAKGKVHAFEIPANLQPDIKYPIAILKSSKAPHLARQFVTSVLDPPGQKVLTAHGFISPMAPRSFVAVVKGSVATRLALPLPSSLPRRTAKTEGPDKKIHSYTGVPLSAVLGAVRGQSLTLTGADEYQRSLPLAEVLKAGAVLVTSKPGILQLVIPGHPPHDWVDWLVSITVN